MSNPIVIAFHNFNYNPRFNHIMDSKGNSFPNLSNSPCPTPDLNAEVQSQALPSAEMLFLFRVSHRIAIPLTYPFTNMYPHIHTCAYTDTYIYNYNYGCGYDYTHIHTCAYTSTSTCTQAHTIMPIQRNAHTHTRTRTRTRTPARVARPFTASQSSDRAPGFRRSHRPRRLKPEKRANAYAEPRCATLVIRLRLVQTFDSVPESQTFNSDAAILFVYLRCIRDGKDKPTWDPLNFVFEKGLRTSDGRVPPSRPSATRLRPRLRICSRLFVQAWGKIWARNEQTSGVARRGVAWRGVAWL